MRDDHPFGTLPVIDVAPLLSSRPAGLPEVAGQIEAACREHGFFYVTGHGPAWRGYFPVGAELTSGRPDLKEGLYFGAELGPDDPRVRAGLPLHGRNLFPRQVPELRSAVLRYMDALTDLGQAVLRGVAPSLSLGTGRTCTRSPAPTATTCWARCPGCSRSSAARC